jgi:Importin-beta N-terminal domain
MNAFKEHPNAWQVVDKILDTATDSNTKFFALQILDEAV